MRVTISAMALALALIGGQTQMAAAAEPGSGNVTLADAIKRAVSKSAPNAAEPHHPDPSEITVGAVGMFSDYPPPAPLAEVLDECDNPKCVMDAGRLAAEAYRVRAQGAQVWSDGEAAFSVIGASGALIGLGHVSRDTLNVWAMAGLLPMVLDDMAQSGAHARLYNVAATAATQLVERYSQINDALRALSGESGNWNRQETQLGSSCAAVVGAAGEVNGLDSSDRPFFKASIDSLTARCALLDATAAKINVAQAEWSGASNGLAPALAADLEYFDDTVARLDRKMRAPPGQAFRSVLALPLNLAASIISGTKSIGDYRGSSNDAFDNHYRFKLTLPGPPDLPSPCPGASPLPDGPGALVRSLKDQLDKMGTGAKGYDALMNRYEAASNLTGELTRADQSLNAVSDEANLVLAALQAVQALSRNPILEVDFKQDNQPVTFEPLS